MKELNTILTELGISKVRLAKYLGVSRQMLYNYLGIKNMEEWPKEKAAKIMSLLGISDMKEIKDIKITGDYIIQVEKRLNEGLRETSNKEIIADLKGFNKDTLELFTGVTDTNNTFSSFIEIEEIPGPSLL